MTETELREIDARVEALGSKTWRGPLSPPWEIATLGFIYGPSRQRCGASQVAIAFLNNARVDIPALLAHVRALEELLWRATTDSEAVELGRQQERARIMADVQGLVDCWMETSTAERLKVGPVWALGELLDRLRREGVPNPLLPPDALRAENDALRDRQAAMEWGDVALFGGEWRRNCCPVCERPQEAGHNPGCRLALAMHGKGGQQP